MEHFGHKLAWQSEMLVFKGPNLFRVAVITKKIKNQPLVLRALGFNAVTKTTFPKFWKFSYSWTDILQYCETQSETTLHLLESGWYDFLKLLNRACEKQIHIKEMRNDWWCRAFYTCVPLGLRDGGRNPETKKSKDRHSREQFHIS